MTDTPRPSRPERIGRYKVVDRIGRGAMGVVYSAHDELMERDVAVKVMMTDLEGEPDIRARFMREAQVSAKLAHRNIVTIYDIGEDNGRLYIVMELLRGETLDRALKQRSFAIEEKVDLVLEVCEGLAVASAAGVCHRDVKPGNLFVQAEGGLKILDFGIARLASSSMTASGFIVGTPDYMSPEQARGVGVDERSDIFSVGAVLYLMLTGRKPFVAPDLPAVLHKVVSEEPPPIDSKEAPTALSRIVFRALSKDPKDRYQTFPDFSADLSRWRRRYETETRTLAERAALSLDALRGLAAEEQAGADALGVGMESDVEARLAEIAASYPLLLASGSDSLRAGEWHRRDIEELDRRLTPLAAACEQRISALVGAAGDLALGKSQLEAGDPAAAMASFENALRQVPSAAIQPFMDRARAAAAALQSRDDRVRSLITEASNARSGGRLDAAIALTNQAIEINPNSADARTLLARLRQDLAAAEAEKTRQCELFVERARQALKLEQLDEADRQLQLAVQTGASNPEITIVRAALTDARAARQSANAVVEDLASQLALARGEFQNGERTLAIARLETLMARHPSSGGLQTELARLRAEHDRLGAAEYVSDEADRLAADAAAALEKGDASAATRLADEALARLPSHESALRTSAVAHARLREAADRAERQDRAAELTESAKSLLARGKIDRAIKEARKAVELDPLGAAHGVIAEALRRQASAAAAEASEQEAARRATEIRELLESSATALRNKDFGRAREHAERALALEPNASAPKDLIARIATAAALALADKDDDTVRLDPAKADPDDTAVIAPTAETRSPGKALSSKVAARLRTLFQSRPAKSAEAGVAAHRDRHRKEA